MANNLEVVKPFGVMEVGDVFELSQNGMYVSNNEWSQSTDDADENVSFSIKQTCEMSEEYVNFLKKNGFLKDKDDKFINVFDEIEKLAKQYNDELSTLDKDYENAPACMKLEKETVLMNMLKVLNHLHSLKK